MLQLTTFVQGPHEAMTKSLLILNLYETPSGVL